MYIQTTCMIQERPRTRLSPPATMETAVAATGAGGGRDAMPGIFEEDIETDCREGVGEQF
jgi:hypothetical protein